MLKESSLSSRWETENMDARERNSIFIKELGMTMGSAWGALKKSRARYKLALRNGDYDRVEELKARISKLRTHMGIQNEELY
jgi:hypothetical protein